MKEACSTTLRSTSNRCRYCISDEEPTCLMKRSASSSWFSAHRSSSTRKKLKAPTHTQRVWWTHTRVLYTTHTRALYPLTSRMLLLPLRLRRHALAVPVVDLLDVSEDHLVFSSHVLRDPSDLQSGHEALRRTFVLLYKYKSHLNVWREAGSHLHDHGQVLHVVLLRLDHLVHHEPEEHKDALSFVSLHIRLFVLMRLTFVPAELCPSSPCPTRWSPDPSPEPGEDMPTPRGLKWLFSFSE